MTELDTREILKAKEIKPYTWRWWLFSKAANLICLNICLLPRVYYTIRVQDTTKEQHYFSTDQTSLDPIFALNFAVPPTGLPWYKRINIHL